MFLRKLRELWSKIENFIIFGSKVFSVFLSRTEMISPWAMNKRFEPVPYKVKALKVFRDSYRCKQTT